MVLRGLTGVSILAVDEDPDSLELMRMFLAPTGATVIAPSARRSPSSRL